MKKIFVSALLSTLFAISCKNEIIVENPTTTCDLLGNDDYLIFGTNYGFCVGNCSSLFKLTSTSLFEDDIDRLEQDKAVTFKSTALSTAKVEIAKTACAQFPNDLNNEKDERIGCPDCHDQGTIYIELKKNGVVKKWYIDPDQNQSTIPTYLQAYTKIVRDVVDQLKK
jgi:hypothetical protein